MSPPDHKPTLPTLRPAWGLSGLGVPGSPQALALCLPLCLPWVSNPVPALYSWEKSGQGLPAGVPAEGSRWEGAAGCTALPCPMLGRAGATEAPLAPGMGPLACRDAATVEGGRGTGGHSVCLQREARHQGVCFEARRVWQRQRHTQGLPSLPHRGLAQALLGCIVVLGRPSQPSSAPGPLGVAPFCALSRRGCAGPLGGPPCTGASFGRPAVHRPPGAPGPSLPLLALPLAALPLVVAAARSRAGGNSAAGSMATGSGVGGCPGARAGPLPPQLLPQPRPNAAGLRRAQRLQAAQEQFELSSAAAAAALWPLSRCSCGQCGTHGALHGA